MGFLEIAHVRGKDRFVPQDWSGSASLGSSSCQTRMIPGEKRGLLVFLMELTDEESERFVSEAVQGSPIVGPRAMSATHKECSFGPAIPANLCSHTSIWDDGAEKGGST